MKTSVTITSENYLLAKTPLTKPPPKTHLPNWKLHSIVMWMEFTIPLIWMLGVNFYMYQMTMHFKGHYAEK